MWPGSELETGARFGDSYQDPSLTSCPEAAEKLIGLKGTGFSPSVITLMNVALEGRLRPGTDLLCSLTSVP